MIRASLLILMQGLVLMSSFAMASTQMATLPVDFYKDPADQARQLKLRTKNTTQISVLSPVEAQQLFQAFRQDNRIPWNYTTDGCYARASAMVQLAEHEQITMGKVFAYGKLSHNWQYHVATVVYVNGNESKNLMVFDPSLFGHPVPIAIWNSLLDPQWRVHERTRAFTWGLGSRFQYKPHGFIRNSYGRLDQLDAQAALVKFRKLQK